MEWPQLVGPSYRSQSPLADAQDLVNWYPERIESTGRWALYPCPGLSLFATLPLSPGRGLFAQDGRMFAVGGSTLYELSDAGVVTLRGTMAIDAHPATLTSNGDQGGELFVTSGDLGYILTLETNVFTQVVTDVTMGAFLDGRFLALDATTATLKISELFDGLTWDATQIAQRNTGSDRWIGMHVANRLIYLYGTQSAEVWYDAGTASFPFEAIQEAFMEEGGIGAAFSVARGAHGPIWLGRSVKGANVVYRARGYTPERISDHALEYALQGYGTTTDALGWSYAQNGHDFYVLTFPTAGTTFVYDETLGVWHRRGYWNPAVATYQAYRPLWHCYSFGRHFAQDRTSGAIWELRLDQYLDVDGEGIRRLRRAPLPTLEDGTKRVTVDKLRFHVEDGVGRLTDPGTNPQLIVRVSPDNGRTWGNDRQLAAGPIGAFGRLIEDYRWGQTRDGDGLVELVATDPVPWRVIDGSCDLTLGRS